MNPIRRFDHLSEGVLVMKLLLLLSAIIVVTALSVRAQQSTTLTLEKAVQLALEKNTSVIEAQNNLTGRQSAVQASFGRFLPSVDASGSYSSNTNWISPLEGVNSKTYSAGLSSNVVLFDGFANTSRFSAAKSDASSAEYLLTRAQQATIYGTHVFFLKVVQTYELLKVNEDNLKRSQRQLERITESNKVGAVALADVYRQQVQVGTDELNLIQAQNNYEKAKADLVANLGVDFNTEYVSDFSGIPTEIDTAEFSPLNARYADFSNLRTLIDSKRPDYQSTIQSYNSADASVVIARAGHYPSVNANLSYGGSSNNDFSRLSDSKSLHFGMTVTLPIFSGFSTQSQIEQAEIFRKNADEEVKKKRRDMTVELRKALLDLEAAEKQVSVTKSSVASAEEDRKIAEEKYSLGAGTLLDLLIANANYTTALSNKVNTAINYLLSKKQLEFVLGTISK